MFLSYSATSTPVPYPKQEKKTTAKAGKRTKALAAKGKRVVAGKKRRGAAAAPPQTGTEERGWGRTYSN